MFNTEFYTAFEDGSSITTSTNPTITNVSKKKIYRSGYNHLEPQGLLEKHREAVTKHGQQARVGAASLEGLAGAIDEFMERQGDMWY